MLQVGLGARGLYGLPRRFPLVYETYKGWDIARLSQPFRLPEAQLPSQGGALG